MAAGMTRADSSAVIRGIRNDPDIVVEAADNELRPEQLSGGEIISGLDMRGFSKRMMESMDGQRGLSRPGTNPYSRRASLFLATASLEAPLFGDYDDDGYIPRKLYNYSIRPPPFKLRRLAEISEESSTMAKWIVP